ncbi:hypothetical protein PG993_013748 [Apiospora rasikravindrae]|uniref:F-box domain-containing protein n=1 Tax=Apiospora rasikravindrae TaxID=990691 RepID=A0ABR1RRG9_9PEZI
MSSGMFARLPAELLGEIERVLPFQDRLRLSAVDWRLRQCVAPSLYSTIRFSNRLADRDTIADVVAKYGHRARALALTLDLAVPELKGEEAETTTTNDQTDASPGLPSFTRDLLSGKTLPGISSFLIQFTADPDSKVGFPAHFQDSETEYEDWVDLWSPLPADRLAIAESKALWRQCLTATWQALVDNPVTIRHLSLQNLVPVESSVWLTPAWSTFLGQVESLSLGLWDSKEILYRDDDMSVTEFQDCMDDRFYRHATSLQRLGIVASPGQPYGTAVWGTPTLALDDTDCPTLPNLRELRVVNCTLSNDLAALIAARALSGLRRVELVDCVSGTNVDYHDPIWEFFFKTILRYLHGDRGRRWSDAVSSILASGRSLLELEDFVLTWSDAKFELAAMNEAAAHELENHSLGLPPSSVERQKHEAMAQDLRDRIRDMQDQKRAGDEVETVFPYTYTKTGLVGPRGANSFDAATFKELLDFVKASREPAKDARC